MCQQTVLRFQISLRRKFSNAVSDEVMKQYHESAAVQFFRLFNMLTVESCSETGLVRH